MESRESQPPLSAEDHERQRNALRIELGAKRRLAHEVLFKHRHGLASPWFHNSIIDAWHSDIPKIVFEGFRDSAKSTRAEEAMIIQALLGEFKNGLVVGASDPRARERLAAIANELEHNEAIEYLFGRQTGAVWQSGKIVLANGVCIQAAGSGASLRGIKHFDDRPDMCLIDDLEDEETVKNPKLRDETMVWLYGALMGALAKGARIRFLGNRLDNDAVIVRISKMPEWVHYKYPIMYQDERGVERCDLPPGKWVATWPEKASILEIAAKRAEYERIGMLHTFNCEYMCEADDPEARLFSAGQAKHHAEPRTWQVTYAAYDPARTVNQKSAMTGKAVFSWIGARLIVWSGDARLWLPDQIVDDILAVDDQFTPVEIGVEATGLEEFIMQPLRHRALQHRQLLPLRRLKPPVGKTSFIRGLQPFFKAGEIEFVDVSGEARAQLLSFPTGRMDFPNALAYALMMKPGQPVYDGFSVRSHVSGTLLRTRDAWYLAANATAQFTAAVLLQVVDGQLRVHNDWLREGPPGETLADIVDAARLEAGKPVRLYAPPIPGLALDTVGLRVAARSHQLEVRNGGDILKGREATRTLLAQRRREEPLILVNAPARWVLNAFAGGFAYQVTKSGQLTREPTEGPYRVMMEGLESFVAVMRGVGLESTDDRPRTAVDSSGRVYKTILPGDAPEDRELKIP